MSTNELITLRDDQKLGYHLNEVLSEQRRFETAAQSVLRMIMEKDVQKVTRGGKTTFDFPFFREGDKHIISWYEEINGLVNFLSEAARGGSGAEQAFTLVGEPGNGKTFFVEYLCDRYRDFLILPENKRYTVEFINLEEIGYSRKLNRIQSQTFEDPVILAMNIAESKDKSSEYLNSLGFSEEKLEEFYRNYRALGACTDYIWNDIREHCEGDIEKMLKFVRVVPVRISENSGTMTGKYSARDKITSSATDLLGEEDISRILNLGSDDHPYKYNVRRGAIARVGGGGIHFSDELFKNKKDLVQIYLGVIQNRTIELDGYKWPVDSLVIATSNNAEFNRFIAEKEEAPIKDRCTIAYISHNTDYKLQEILTRYVLGTEKRATITGRNLHEDPNLEYALSVGVTLTRLPDDNKLTPIEMMKLEAGEVAGEKSQKTLLEVKEKWDSSQDVTKRWGQKGVGQRGLGRIVQRLLAMTETHEGACMFAKDAFKALEREIIDYIPEEVDRKKYVKDMYIARRLYRERIKVSIFNAYRDDPQAINKEVLAYVNMVIGMSDDKIGPDNTWRYKDPQTGDMKSIRIDKRFIEAVESRMPNLTSEEARENFRTSISKIYAQKISSDPSYDFMDNEALVKAVTDVRLESDVEGASSLVGALSNRTNEENVKVYNRMIDTMLNNLGYCKTCAEKTIEYFCEKDDES